MINYVNELKIVYLNALKKRRYNAYIKLSIPLIAGGLGFLGGLWKNELLVSLASGSVGGVSFVPVALDFVNTKGELDHDEFILKDHFEFFKYRALEVKTEEEKKDLEELINEFRSNIKKKSQ